MKYNIFGNYKIINVNETFIKWTRKYQIIKQTVLDFIMQLPTRLKH